MFVLKKQSTPFRFLDPGELRDGELWLHLAHRLRRGQSESGVPSYYFHLHRNGFPRPIGHINLRVGDSDLIERYLGHIGYAVADEHRGHRFAERACRLILPLAARHGLVTLWITCNPDNQASRRTLERLGGEMIEVVDVPADLELYRRGEVRKCRFRLDLARL